MVLFQDLLFWAGWTDLHHICCGHRETSSHSAMHSWYRFVALFWNKSGSKASEVKTRIWISHNMRCCQQFSCRLEVNFNNLATFIVPQCIINSSCQVSKQSGNVWLSTDNYIANYLRSFFTGVERNCQYILLRGKWTKLHQMWSENRLIIAEPNSVLWYQQVPSFWNEGDSKERQVVLKIEAKFRTYWPP